MPVTSPSPQTASRSEQAAERGSFSVGRGIWANPSPSRSPYGSEAYLYANSYDLRHADSETYRTGGIAWGTASNSSEHRPSHSLTEPEGPHRSLSMGALGDGPRRASVNGPPGTRAAPAPFLASLTPLQPAKNNFMGPSVSLLDQFSTLADATRQTELSHRMDSLRVSDSPVPARYQTSSASSTPETPKASPVPPHARVSRWLPSAGPPGTRSPTGSASFSADQSPVPVSASLGAPTASSPLIASPLPGSVSGTPHPSSSPHPGTVGTAPVATPAAPAAPVASVAPVAAPIKEGWNTLHITPSPSGSSGLSSGPAPAVSLTPAAAPFIPGAMPVIPGLGGVPLAGVPSGPGTAAGATATAGAAGANGRGKGKAPPPRKKDWKRSRKGDSPLLEELRQRSRGLQIADILGNVVDVAMDQHGSRFIQEHLASAAPEMRQALFAETHEHRLQLMTDVFGNYVIQQMFELGTPAQRSEMAAQMKGRVLGLSLQMYGCRVVQMAIRHCNEQEQVVLVDELRGQVVRCIKDHNGNHVIQKAIESVAPPHVQFIYQDLMARALELARHTYGCRVVQRILEHGDAQTRTALIALLRDHIASLVEDQYGNYVVQHLVDNGPGDVRATVLEALLPRVISLSAHKYASNVIEKCFLKSSPTQRSAMIESILVPDDRGVPAVVNMVKDQYANYVVQKILDTSQGTDYARLSAAIKPYLAGLKRNSYGKHLASIERLLHD